MNKTAFPVASAVLVIAGVLLLQSAAWAGPPLICRPFHIGDSRSLPFLGPEWSRIDPGYDRSRLVNDTLALLAPDTPVIVRMETIRRAALYGRDDARIAEALQEQLQARGAKLVGRNDAASRMALFDLGYLVETYRQAAIVSRSGESFWKFAQAEPKIDGYSMVAKAIAQGGGPEMEFAAALMTSDHRDQHYEEHLRKAIAGARPGSLLAQNIATHFPDAVRSAGLAAH